MLSERVDLTEHRDFGPERPPFSGEVLDLLAFETTRTLTVNWDVSPDNPEDIILISRKVYPWNIYDLNSDTMFPEFLYTDDDLSRTLGVEFHGEMDRPFLFGNKADRIFGRDLIAQESCIVCHSCGRKITLFDMGSTICRHCLNQWERDKALEELHSV